MTEYWTPEEQGRIAEAAARVRQDDTIMATSVGGIGYVYADGSVIHAADWRRDWRELSRPCRVSISHEEVQARIDELQAQIDELRGTQ